MPSKLMPYVRSESPIPEKTIVAAFNGLHQSSNSQRRRDIANEIMPGAGDYLPEIFYLSAFIKFEIADDEVEHVLLERKSFFKRASNLIPKILSLIEVEDEGQATAALINIEDCCFDFNSISSASHARKYKREILQRISEVESVAKLLNELLNDAWKHVEAEYELHQAATSRVKRRASVAENYIDLIRDNINGLSFAAQVLLFKEETGSDAFYVHHNRAKSHVVECAYRLAIRRETPKFVTTPGSDFSLLSSLIFELASGEQDDGLAGAINRFGRSDLRREIDEDEREIRWENSEEYKPEMEADNFAEINEKIKQHSEELDFWEAMAESKAWGESENEQIAIRVFDVKERIEFSQSQHGPFLVWASQVSTADQMEFSQKIEEIQNRSLELEIKIGQLKRRSS